MQQIIGRWPRGQGGGGDLVLPAGGAEPSPTASWWPARADRGEFDAAAATEEKIMYAAIH